MSSFNLEDKTKEVLDIILLKSSAFSGNDLYKDYINFFNCDIYLTKLSVENFYNILLRLKKEKFIDNVIDKSRSKEYLNAMYGWNFEAEDQPCLAIKLNKKFYEHLKRLNNGSKHPLENKIIFNMKKAILRTGKYKIQFPPDTDESILCNIMVELKKDEFVSWDEIYEKMTGSETENTKKDSKKVFDAINRVNNRIKNSLKIDDDFLERSNNKIRRNY